MKTILLSTITLICLLLQVNPIQLCSQTDITLDLLPSERQVGYSPADGESVTVNPPPFTWVQPKHELTYALEISQDSDFSSDTERIGDIQVSTYALTHPLKSGTWYWRYGVELDGDRVLWSKVRKFRVGSSAQKFVKPKIEEVISRIPKNRPRLFVLENELASYQERAESGDLQSIANSLKRSCKKYIGEPLVEEPPYVQGTGPERGKHYQHIFRTTRPPMDAMERCGLVYLLTGDKEYGNEAKRRLLHFFSWDPEGSTSYRNNDEPAMWVMMRGTRAYDWVYDLFTEEERQKIEPVMKIRARQFFEHLKDRRKFHTDPYESHAGRTLGFLGEAALSFAHQWPEAETWLDYVLTLFWNVYPAWGKEDGGWHEGPSYWSYYMSFALHFVVPLRNATSIDLMQKPFFQNTPYYKLYTNPPYAEISPFGDGEHSGPSRSMGNLMYQFSTLLQDPYLRWYANAMNAGPGNSILGVVLKDDSLKAKSPSTLPQSRYFPGVGLVSIHTALGNAGEDVHFLIHSDPFGPISHAHADENAFTLEAYGEALAIASGYYPWYGSDHHRNWQWQSKSSNTITFDGGQGQVIRDAESKGNIVAFQSTDDYDYVQADATEAYQGRLNRCVRHVAHIGNGVFVLCDEVAARRPVQFEWNLHALSEMELDTEKNVMIIQQSQARLRTNFLHPQDLSIKQWKGFEHPPEHGESDQYHARASTANKTQSTIFVTVLEPYTESRKPSIETKINTLNEKGVTVELDDGETRTRVQFLLDRTSHVEIQGKQQSARCVIMRGNTLTLLGGDI